MLTLLPPPDAYDLFRAGESRHVGRGAPLSWQPTPLIVERRAKMRAIGAALFARGAETGSTILDIARAAGVPPSRSAHGYRRREEVLFDILCAHVDALHEYMGEAADRFEDADPLDRLIAMTEALLRGVHDHADAHHLLLYGLGSLPAGEREALRYPWRTLTHRLAMAIGVAARDSGWPATIAARDLLAAIGYSRLWWRGDGALSRRGYAEMLARASLGRPSHGLNLVAGGSANRAPRDAESDAANSERPPPAGPEQNA